MNMETITDGIYILKDFMKSTNTLQEIIDQCEWGKFTINNKVLCRDGCFQGVQLENGIVPWLRCPSIEYQEILPWTPVIENIKNWIEKELGYKTNIGKIQKYESGTSFIASHTDKIIDLDPKTPIFVARFGASRICELINKVTGQTINVVVPHNSLLVIEYSANLLWKHGIVKDVSITEPSYSIVFRQSITYKHPRGYIYGPNTPFKTIRDLEEFSMDAQYGTLSYFWNRETQSKKMIECFNLENKNVSDISFYKEVIEKAIYPF
jgi:hypothetical protein